MRRGWLWTVGLCGVGAVNLACSGSSTCDSEELSRLTTILPSAADASRRYLATVGIAEACGEEALAHGEHATPDVRARMLADYAQAHPDEWESLCGGPLDPTRINPFEGCDVSPLGWSQSDFDAALRDETGELSQSVAARELFVALAAQRVKRSGDIGADALIALMAPQ